MIHASFEKTFEGWRDVARQYLLGDVAPSEIQWSDERPSLFSETAVLPLRKKPVRQPTVPPEFLKLAQSVAYARDDERWALLYRILYRLQHENSDLMKITVDPDILRAQQLAKSVGRDIHKMHAFVRFKKATIDGVETYVAWHRPEHLIIRPATPFFARRFGDRRWSIWTVDESAHWDLEKLTFGPGMEQRVFAVQDEWDDVWKTYYKSIFNPARIKMKMMKAEMAPKYWSSMPETALIRELVREAPQRLQTMAANHNHAAVVDPSLSLAELREKAKACTACPIYGHATQTVFGVGNENADLMVIGEQPGDQEDIEGQPFVGPAGEVLDQALKLNGLNREDLYLTNAVKHFKWTPQGKFRIHQRASGREMHACRPWLEAEIKKVRPKVILALGVTAATAVLGRLPKISQERGKVFSDLKIAPAVIISWHPAAILRANSPSEASQRQQQFEDDVRLARRESARP